jgi:hypothetical protein
MSKELAADYFARHSNDECHITSDGRVFHTKGSADSFANGLKDNTVVSFTRDGKKEEKEDLKQEISEGEKEARFKERVTRLIELGYERSDDLFFVLSTGAQIDVNDVYETTDEEFEVSITSVKVFGLEDLKAFDTATASYAEIKALAKGLNLESASQSKVDLLAAIEAQKVIINTEVQD